MALSCLYSLPPSTLYANTLFTFSLDQERAAEVSAARLRAVDRLVTGEKSELESAGKESRDDRVVLGPAAEEGDDAAEYLPLDAAADLEPEEAPLPVRFLLFELDAETKERSCKGDIFNIQHCVLEV